MRITEKALQILVDSINKRTKNPLKPYEKDETGTFRAQIGNYHLDFAYGGVQLVRMVSEGGGIDVISTGGYGTKRNLYNQLQFLDKFLWDYAPIKERGSK